MKLIQKTVIVAACLLAANAAHAQFGSLGGMLGGAVKGGASTGGDISADVDAFVKKSGALSLMTAQSLFAINSAFLSDTEAESQRAELAKLGKITDPAELAAKTAAVYKTQSAETDNLMKSGELDKKIAALDADKKKKIGGALMNFAIGALQAAELAKNGQGLVQKTAANPMQLPKVLPVKDSLPLLAQVVSDSAGFVSGLAKVAKGANISVPPVKADSKPVDLGTF